MTCSRPDYTDFTVDDDLGAKGLGVLLQPAEYVRGHFAVRQHRTAAMASLT